jgi:hypothetical protein
MELARIYAKTGRFLEADDLLSSTSDTALGFYHKHPGVTWAVAYLCSICELRINLAIQSDEASDRPQALLNELRSRVPIWTPEASDIYSRNRVMLENRAGESRTK